MVFAIISAFLIGGALMYLFTPRPATFTAQEYNRLKELSHHYADVDRQVEKHVEDVLLEKVPMTSYGEFSEYVYLNFKFKYKSK